METLQTQILKLTKKNLQLVSDLEEKFVEALSKDIERGARKNFNNARESISGDDPTVIVTRVKNSPKSATIVCGGEQVLYAEFGAGVENSMWTTEFLRHSYNSDFSIRSITTVFRDFTARGFSFVSNSLNEKAPRPNGIGDLGFNPLAWHTPSWGLNDFWFRRTENGRTGLQETLKKKSNGEVDDRYVWTKGTRPIRALWRARNSALRRLKKEVKG